MAPPPSQIKAIAITGRGTAGITTVPLPKQRDDYILVRTTAVALNPTDWKAIDWMGPPGVRVGCDYAGLVEAVGPNVTKPFAKGDRVCGFSHGSNISQPEDGAFAEFIMAKADVAMRIPDNVTDEEAASLGVGITTVGQGLYQALKLPLPTTPSSRPFPLLIYGGSTATGILGIQFAVASGAVVATTCSPRNFDYMRSLGASFVVDHASPTAAAEIRSWAASYDGGLRLAWDCWGTAEAASVCVAAMAEGECHYRSLLPVADEAVTSVNPAVDNGFTLAYTAFGEGFTKGREFPPVPEDLQFASMFWDMSRGLLEEGRVRPARLDVNRGGTGLEGVLKGLQDLRNGKVSGVKLVYTI